MNDKQEPSRRRPKGRGFFGGLKGIGRPPLTTPQWKDALREQERRGPRRKRD